MANCLRRLSAVPRVISTHLNVFAGPIVRQSGRGHIRGSTQASWESTFASDVAEAIVPHGVRSLRIEVRHVSLQARGLFAGVEPSGASEVEAACTVGTGMTT